MTTVYSEMQTQLRETFLEEAGALADQLETSLLALEQNQEDEEHLREAFRAAHTVKGSAAGVGFKEMAAFTHQMENALEALREHRRRLTPGISSLLLEGVDLLRAFLAAARAGSPPPDAIGWVARVNGLFTPAEGTAAESTFALKRDSNPVGSLQTHGDGSQTRSSLEIAGGDDLFRVRFTLPEGSFARGLDPVALLRALSDESSVLRVTPLLDRLPPLEEMDPTGCYLGFDLVVSTRGGEADLRSVFEFCPEGSTVEIAHLQGQEWLNATGPGESQGERVDSLCQEPTSAVQTEARRPQPREDTSDCRGNRKIGGDAANGDGQTIRVKQRKLDSFMDLVGELVTARNALLHLERTIETEYHLPELARKMKETTAAVNRTVGQLQSDVLSLRMVPLSTIFQRLPRIVRDVATSQGKKVTFHVSGEETEVDRTVADALSDPMVHLVRNGVDHGIEDPDQRHRAGKAEVGHLWVAARREGNSVVIEVRDDGAGIDPGKVREAAVRKGLLDPGTAARMSDSEALDLVFAAGLSTASRVSDISGRGVGMDVVRGNVMRMGGKVSVASSLGQGTTFSLELPLTLSVFRALIARAGEETFALPLSAVRETAAVAGQRIQTLRGHPVLAVRGQLVAIVSLAEIMGMRQSDTQRRSEREEDMSVVVVEAGGEQVGLLVEALDQPQEILVKPLEGYLSAGGAVGGASVMGDGRLALVLDPLGVVGLALKQTRQEGCLSPWAATGGQRCLR